MGTLIDSNKKLKRYFAEKLRELPGSAAPRCPHFGECGGCALQHLTESEQTSLKQEALNLILGFDEEVQLTPAPSEYEYRMRMDYVSIAHPIHAPHERLGLRKKGNFSYVIDLETCHLIPPTWFKKLRQIFNLATELELEKYDLVKYTGELRYLVIRLAGEQAMLNIVTKSNEQTATIEKMAGLALELGFTSVHWLVQPTQSDVSFADSVRFWGVEYLTAETSASFGKQFLVGPNTFFQNNMAAFEQILEYVSEFIPEEAKTLTDLYCGVGTIGICLAEKFDQVLGIEVNEHSIELAKRNVEQNDLNNFEFYIGDVPAYLSETKSATPDVCIVDPPRAGLMPAGVEQVRDLAADLLIYISCNPITQKQDLDGGLLQDYEIVAARGFDMFPQTFHMENVVVLRKRD